VILSLCAKYDIESATIQIRATELYFPVVVDIYETNSGFGKKLKHVLLKLKGLIM